MKRSWIWLAYLAAAMPVAADSPSLRSPAYTECMSLANDDPEKALVSAQAWLATDKSVSARHCEAMALYGLKRYAEAAESLEKASLLIPPENMALRSFVTRQASAAWLKARRPEQANAILTEQILEMSRGEMTSTTAKLTSDLLLDRARLQIVGDRLDAATKDLDRALSLNPTSAAALLERARTYELQDQDGPARDDAQGVLALDPNNKDARRLLARLKEKNLIPAH